MNEPLLEACVDSYASAEAACRGGADRLELCANLSIGGTTPSPALFRQIQRDFSVPVNVLLRPRFGDFLYDRQELEEIREELCRFRDLGANGAVIGVLTPEGRLDEEALASLMSRAGGLEITLHRAFDMTLDPLEALETAVSLGFRTILTSGQAQSAPAGAAALRKLLRQAAGRLDIMAGGGVKSENLLTLHEATGIRVFHTSGRRGTVDSGMRYRKEGVSMGLPSLSEYTLWRTDPAEIQACRKLVHGLRSGF